MGKKKKLEISVAGAAFIFFVLITCYRLTYAPLWYDEAVEFWYSKIMFGRLPYQSLWANASENMYQRIINTYQPPLYNVIMHFWLKFGTTEWWVRFFGVVMGFIGNIGIYKTTKKISNGFVAAGAVFCSSCVVQLVYYWQEAAEYCLMLATLCWTVYAFICLLKEQSLKNIIFFTIISILTVYSQYGAVFPVAVMLIIVYIIVLFKKDKKNIISMTVSYLAALIFAAIPLIYFFLIKQMRRQQSAGGQIAEESAAGNIFVNMFNGLKTTVLWNLVPHCHESVAMILTWIFIICTVLFLIFSKKAYVKILAVTNIVTWLIYYVTVKKGLYSYGQFGSRYNLFFIPLWLITIFCFGYEIYEIIKENTQGKLKYLSFVYTGICLIIAAAFMISGWTMKIQHNWIKEDMRGAVAKWEEVGAKDSHTIVYYGDNGTFAYYVRQLDDYSPDTEKNVDYMPWLRGRTVEEYKKYIDSIYGKDWPKEVCLIGVHRNEDINLIISAFTDNGYAREDLYNNYGMFAKLTYNE